MKVTSRNEAWRKADELFPTDYYQNTIKTANAGYPIYDSTLGDEVGYICDLGCRLEVNIGNETINIWFEEAPQFKEYQIADALSVISNAIYKIDDNILPGLQNVTGIGEARDTLYGAYAKITKILEEQHPDSRLFEQYNLR